MAAAGVGTDWQLAMVNHQPVDSILEFQEAIAESATPGCIATFKKEEVERSLVQNLLDHVGGCGHSQRCIDRERAELASQKAVAKKQRKREPLVLSPAPPSSSESEADDDDEFVPTNLAHAMKLDPAPALPPAPSLPPAALPAPRPPPIPAPPSDDRQSSAKPHPKHARNPLAPADFPHGQCSVITVRNNVRCKRPAAEGGNGMCRLHVNLKAAKEAKALAAHDPPVPPVPPVSAAGGIGSPAAPAPAAPRHAAPSTGTKRPPSDMSPAALTDEQIAQKKRKVRALSLNLCFTLT